MSYYESLEEADDAARRVGWLRRIGQAFRFELVAQVADDATRIIDFGCGEGELADYLARRDGDSRSCKAYMGIDARPGAIEKAKHRWRTRSALSNSGWNVEFIVGDFFELPVDLAAGDCVVCLGGLVDGEPHTESSMRARGEQLFEIMRSAGAGILAAIDLDSLPMWRRDAALAGVRASWFEDVSVETPIRDELVVVWGGALDGRAARAAVARGPLGPWSAAERAWLAERCGAHAEARALLSVGDVGDEALAQLVEERLGP